MGEKVQRPRWYRLTFRAWLNNRQPAIWKEPFGLCDHGPHISDNGKAMTADFRYDRVFLIAGLFYGIEGMRVGGKRTLKISPHLAYRDKGIEGVNSTKRGSRNRGQNSQRTHRILRIRFHSENPFSSA
jgi:hypothetical protein